MAARQVQHTFQTPEAQGLLQRLLDLEDEIQTHYQAQPVVRPAPAQPPVYEFATSRLLSAVTYISGEGVAAGAPVVPVAERARVADDLIQILRQHVAYENFVAADFALVGLPEVIAELPRDRAEEWAQVGVGAQTLDHVFAQHSTLQPPIHIPVNVQEYFRLQGDGRIVYDALRQIPVQQQQRQRQNIPPPAQPLSRGERVAVSAGLGTLVLGALIAFGSYQGWNCGRRPSSPPAQKLTVPVTSPSTPSSAPTLPPDAGVPDAYVPQHTRADGSAMASMPSSRSDAAAPLYTAPPAQRMDGGIPAAASAGTISVPPVSHLDAGTPAQPVAPAVPGPVAPIAPVAPAIPYTAQTPSPKMDGGVPAASPYVAAPAAPVAPPAPVAPVVPPVISAPAVACPPVPACPAPVDLLTTMLTGAQQYVAGHSWEQIVAQYATVPVAVSIRSYKGRDPKEACELGIGQLVDLTIGSMPGAQQHSLYNPVRSAIISKGVDACAAHVQLGANRDRDIRFGLGLDKL